MIVIPKWTIRHNKALEDYFKEDEEGNSKHREDYHRPKLHIRDINNYIVNLYNCPLEERWERVQELIPVKWYLKILKVIGLGSLNKTCNNCKYWDYPNKNSLAEQCNYGGIDHIYKADFFGCNIFELKD